MWNQGLVLNSRFGRESYFAIASCKTHVYLNQSSFETNKHKVSKEVKC